MTKKTAKKAAKKAVAKKAAKKTAAALPEADWTILVYLAGDNDLDYFGGRDVLEMKQVGSSDRLHIIVQRDTVEMDKPARRYRLRHGTTLEDDMIEDLGKINTGDPVVLQDFLEWGLAKYPSKRTMVVLWNHGSGWDDEDIYAEARRRGLKPPARPTLADVVNRGPGPSASPLLWTVNRAASQSRNRGSFFLTAYKMADTPGDRRAIAFDDGAQDFLDSVEMKNVLNAVSKARGKKFDVIGMDACLMAMLEVGMQVEEAAEVLCASQELEPGDGWPYETVLAALAADLSMDGASLCRTIVEKFVDSYPPEERVTQSAVDLSKLGAVQKAADALGSLLTRGYRSDDDRVISSVERVSRKAQRYDLEGKAQYVDLHDFCSRIAVALPVCAELAKKVQDAIDACVISSRSPYAGVANSHGISIYLPHGKVSELYGNLDSGTGGWARFLTTRIA